MVFRFRRQKPKRRRPNRLLLTRMLGAILGTVYEIIQLFFSFKDPS